jgi:hypothetical protein
LRSLRGRYPGAYFVVWATDASKGEIGAEVSKAVQDWKASGETKAEFVMVPGLQFSACHWHPSLADDRVIYGRIAGVIDLHPQVWQGR